MRDMKKKVKKVHQRKLITKYIDNEKKSNINPVLSSPKGFPLTLPLSNYSRNCSPGNSSPLKDHFKSPAS